MLRADEMGIISTDRKPSGKGYVYILWFVELGDIYKIGNSSRLYQRCQCLASVDSSINIVAYGFAQNRLQAERYLQGLFFKSLAERRYWWSLEYFKLTKEELNILIEVFRMVCPIHIVL